jgi:hypothetical protein
MVGFANVDQGLPKGMDAVYISVLEKPCRAAEETWLRMVSL